MHYHSAVVVSNGRVQGYWCLYPHKIHGLSDLLYEGCKNEYMRRKFICYPNSDSKLVVEPDLTGCLGLRLEGTNCAGTCGQNTRKTTVHPMVT